MSADTLAGGPAKDLITKLLAAVCDDPDDMQPRRIMADLLSERGDPRGAFINAQLRLYERGLSPGARRTFNAQVERLLEENGSTWAAPAVAMGARYEFRRGFLYKLSGEIEQILEYWPALRAREPVVHLEVQRATRESMAPLTASGILSEIRHLTVRGDIGDYGAEELAAGDLRTIKWLNLRDLYIEDDGVAALARASDFRPHRLTLTGNPVTDEGLAALATSEVLKDMERLFLSRTDITSAGVAALAASPHLGNLRELCLSSVEELDDDGLFALADSPYLTSLRYIEVHSCWGVRRPGVLRLRERFAKVKSE